MGKIHGFEKNPDVEVERRFLYFLRYIQHLAQISTTFQHDIYMINCINY